MHLSPDLRDGAHQPVSVQVTFHREIVEICCNEKLFDTTERQYLRGWLASPVGMLAYDDVVWAGLDHGVALSIDGIVPQSPLPDRVVTVLRLGV